MLMSKALYRSSGVKNFSPQAKRLGLKNGQAAPRHWAQLPRADCRQGA